MKQKVSNIFKKSDIDSNAFNSLTPLMKEAIEDVFKLIEKEAL